MKREVKWTFVWNRVQEIRELTDINCWNHVPGQLKPANIRCRGCSSENLLESKWWESPSWLLKSSVDWLVQDYNFNEEFVKIEKI